MDKERCKAYVMEPGGFHQHQCYKPIWRDGYCKIHHPTSVEKREKEKEERYELRYKNDPLRKYILMVGQLNRLIKKLEKKEKMGICCDPKKMRISLERVIKGGQDGKAKSQETSL
jgi:hypothetical protein